MRTGKLLGALTTVDPLAPPRVKTEELRRAIDLELERYEHDIGITVLRRQGDIQVVTVK